MFTYPGSPVSDIGFKTNYALTDISVTGIPDHGKSKMYAGAGWHSGRGPYELPVVFVNDVRRTDKQQGIFGELSIDINDDIELTLERGGTILRLILKVVQMLHLEMVSVDQMNKDLELISLFNTTNQEQCQESSVRCSKLSRQSRNRWCYR